MINLDKVSKGVIIMLVLFVSLTLLIAGCNYIYDNDFIWIPLLISFLVAYTYVLVKK